MTNIVYLCHESDTFGIEQDRVSACLQLLMKSVLFGNDNKIFSGTEFVIHENESKSSRS